MTTTRTDSITSDIYQTIDGKRAIVKKSLSDVKFRRFGGHSNTPSSPHMDWLNYPSKSPPFPPKPPIPFKARKANAQA
jgi:hypothetical protein